jgi:hypothetical protein
MHYVWRPLIKVKRPKKRTTLIDAEFFLYRTQGGKSETSGVRTPFVLPSYFLVLPLYSLCTPLILPLYSLRTPFVLPCTSFVLPRTSIVLPLYFLVLLMYSLCSPVYSLCTSLYFSYTPMYSPCTSKIFEVDEVSLFPPWLECTSFSCFALPL